VSAFLRRFDSDPGANILLNIESVNIIDQTPPAPSNGVGTGAVCVVGEWEDGPVNVCYEVFSPGNLVANAGGFGFQYGSLVAQNPCARARYADGQLLPEYWNGNGAISVTNKSFSRLFIVRVDTSVGTVQFQPFAFVTGTNALTYFLQNGQIAHFTLNGVTAVTATFTGVAATFTSGHETFPTGFAGGEQLVFSVDGTKFTVTFQSTDQSQAQVEARINAAAGFTFVSPATSSTDTYTGRQGGTGGNVSVVSGTSSALTALGLTVSSVNGSGNVANIANVQFAEVQLVIQTASSALSVTMSASGQLMVFNNQGTTLSVDSATTAVGLGLGPIGIVQQPLVAASGSIPAGTRVSPSGGTPLYVTTMTIPVTLGQAGPFVSPVRPAQDDGSVTSAPNAGAVNTIPFQPAVGAFGVINLAPFTPALTDPQIDAAYITAIASTINLSTVAKETNIILAARTSAAIRAALRQNAIQASASGCRGRTAIVRPPLNTSEDAALSSTAQPGVGITSHKRVWYAYPGVTTYMGPIATLGLNGGAGFTVDGIINVGFDSFVASIASQIPPEENPGETTNYAIGANGLEGSATVPSPNVGSFNINDYIAFKAAGIMAPRYDTDDGVMTVQSGVTSVNPTVDPADVPANRQRFDDFIGDSLAVIAKPYAKKPQTTTNRAALVSGWRSFLSNLVSDERAVNFSLDPKSLNTQASYAAGRFRTMVSVQMNPDFLSIELVTTVGAGVVITEAT
jgi:hypothetical protein